MSNEELINIPNRVDEFDHLLIWQFDEIILVAVGLIVGIIFNSPMMGIIGGFYLKSKYIRIRDGKPSGYFLHRMRDVGLVSDNSSKGTSLQPALVKKFHS